MKSTLQLTISCVLLAGISGFSQGATLQVDWYRTIAPNRFGSVSYGQFWSNTQDAIINNGGADTGSGNSAFTNITSVNGIQTYTTSFESLNGVETAGEFGVRPSWAYLISNDDGSVMDNSILASSTKDYNYTWDGTQYSATNTLALPGFSDPLQLVGVRADGSIGTDINDTYVSFIGIAGISWWASRWTGTLGVDNVWTTDYMVGDADRFDRLAELGAYVGQHQTAWDLSINLNGIDFAAPTIAVVPVPTAAFAGLTMLGSIAGFRTIRRRK